MKANYLIIFLLFFFTTSQASNTESLFNLPQYQDVKISPDAQFISMVVIHENKRALAVLDRKTLKPVGFITLPAQSEVGDYLWANTERLVINVLQKAAWLEDYQSHGELFAVNYDGKERNLIYGYRSGEQSTGSRLNRKKQDNGWAEVINTLPNDDKHILITSTPISEEGNRVATIQKINIYKGYQKKKGRAPAPNVKIITDIDGELKLAVGKNTQGNNTVYFREAGIWKKTGSDKFGSEFTPLTLTNTSDGFYALDNYQQNLTGLFKYTFDNSTYKKIFSDKVVDVTSANLSVRDNNIYALKIDDGYTSYVLLNKNTPQAQTFKKMLSSFPGNIVDISSQSDDDRFYVVKVSSDTHPGHYYLFDSIENKLSSLVSSTKFPDSMKLALKEPFQFTSTDGFPLNGYFTNGISSEGKLPPLVVLVHNDPKSRDLWQYEEKVQYLALNGYSVLQLNYRGSTGYGDKFKNAGNLMWGSKIQQDIKESVDWAVKHNKVLPNKVCIMGEHFGAYSAIQSAILHPDTYQCAITNAGIYDLEMLSSHEEATKKHYSDYYINNVIGNSSSSLQKNSPVNYLERLKRPLFIAHGKRDEKAPLEQALKLKDKLNKLNKTYSWFVIGEESQGFWNVDNTKDYMKQVKSFLDENLQ